MQTWLKETLCITVKSCWSIFKNSACQLLCPVGHQLWTRTAFAHLLIPKPNNIWTTSQLSMHFIIMQVLIPEKCIFIHFGTMGGESSQAEWYLEVFLEMRYSFTKTLVPVWVRHLESRGIVLWLCGCYNWPTHQNNNQVHPVNSLVCSVDWFANLIWLFLDPSGRRVSFMDDFYTHHSLGQALKKMADGKVKITGTCQMNFINKLNALGVCKAIAMLENKPRGSWALVQPCLWQWRKWRVFWPASNQQKWQSAASASCRK